MAQFELGQEAEDIITGFKGIITAHIRYLSGCDQYCLSPRVDNEGKHIDGRYVDEPALKLVKKGRKISLPKTVMDDPGPGEPGPLSHRTSPRGV